MFANMYYFVVSVVCTTPSQNSYKGSRERKGMEPDKTQEITHKSGELSSKSTQADRGSSVQNNTYQLVVTQSTQDDSTLSRGRGTSIYEKMTKEQMLRAGRTQFNKLSSDTQRKSIRLGRPAQSVILSKR
ncbi:unnamed protein product [Litomosoides sigmodontis]|uniref:Uncharacterized protein n=1 Tax=Litomosoides sigmodontis TaxID=42156 RepID=A0A3P6TQQ1_LITSI|nr:unnamed protein product [Litomosoides sigmodontis]